jgi:hypothetical protein
MMISFSGAQFPKEVILMAGLTEVLCYGTAVIVEPDSSNSKYDFLLVT